MVGIGDRSCNTVRWAADMVRVEDRSCDTFR